MSCNCGDCSQCGGSGKTGIPLINYGDCDKCGGSGGSDTSSNDSNDDSNDETGDPSIQDDANSNNSFGYGDGSGYD